MAALIGALRVSLSADTAKFESGMKRAQRSSATAATGIQKSLGLIKSSIAGLAAGLSVGLFVNAIKGALEYAGSLGELAQTLGVTTRDLQVFRFAAGQVGVSQDQLETGLQKLTITLGKVAAGAKEPAKALQAIGVSADQLKGKDAGEAFRIIADGLQKVTDRSQRAAVEVALFGKSGAKLDNLLAGGSRTINEYAAAAEGLGIVLSDEQIQKADATADKLGQLQTVLKTRIAGVVADNADSVVTLADSFGELTAALVKVFGWLSSVGNELASFGGRAPALAEAISAAFLPIIAIAGLIDSFSGKGNASQISVKLPKPKTAGGGAGIGNFLAGGGGGHKPKADHSAEKALRDAFQFDQEIRRADIDILRAKKDLAIDYVEQTTISVQILDAERAAYAAELEYEVKAKDKTKAQAAQLLAAYDIKDSLERQKVLEDEQAQRREDVAMLTQTDFETQKDLLQSQLQIATTAKEQRDLQLKLLDLSYRQERARLEAVIADEKASEAAKEDARRRLLSLNHTFANDRTSVIQNTQGPMEQFFASVPKNAAEAQEAMERLQVQGIDGAINSIIALSDGFQSFRDTAISAIKQVIAELIRMQLMKLAMNLIGSLGGSGGFSSAGLVSGNMAALGGGGIPLGASGGGALPGFASGGAGVFGGMAGIDRNIISMNGLPIAKVSRGEPFAFGPDAMRGHGGPPVTINVNAAMSAADARKTGSQLYAGWAAEQARARVKGI